MKLNDTGLLNRTFWQSKGYTLPEFDRVNVRKNTLSAPVWLHFGAGNIFRAFPAMLLQKLLDEGLYNTGIIVAEGYDYDIIDAAYKPFDDLSVSVTLLPDGSVKKTITGSVVESVRADENGFTRLSEIFKSKTLQMISFTITEKGYYLTGSDGTLQSSVLQDISAGPSFPSSFLGKITSLCLCRYENGAAPLALVSMDNCSQNGILLKKAVSQIAVKWVENGFTDNGFSEYINNPDRLSFPCTMIDKITPYPSSVVAGILENDGIEDMVIVITAKNSVTAPFVNAEEPEYLVIEDAFPNGRPALEKAGVLFTDRQTVDKVEKMKVGTCLNPLHTALSVFACMLGYTLVSDAVKDPDIHFLIKRVAQEGLPVVVDPGIISPRNFIDTVVNVRLPNPYIPDTPQRIVTDTSRKLAARFGETIKAYIETDTLDTASLKAIPLVLAGWFRYMTGTDDEGNTLELSGDPVHKSLLPILSGIIPGNADNIENTLKSVLSNSEIFGVDLYNAGLADTVISYFSAMINGKGAVRRTLQKLRIES